MKPIEALRPAGDRERRAEDTRNRQQLNLSDNTVPTYRRRIMDKLDRHSVAALTKYAISKHGAHHAVLPLAAAVPPSVVKTAPVRKTAAPGVQISEKNRGFRQNSPVQVTENHLNR